MTVYRPKITGGPANDVGLAALAEVLRYAYAREPAEVYQARTDEQALEHFAAFLAGHNRPPERAEPR